jgi:hypothetical protein
MKTTKAKSVEAEELDKKFDRGEDISEHLDLPKARKPALEQKRVNVDFPRWMIESLDQEARRIGVPRQALIKLWIANRLEKGSAGKPED